MEQTNTTPLTEILNGDAPGNIIARDPVKRFAIIESIEPEAAVHWLAIPYEPYGSIEQMEKADPARFLQLVEFAISETKARCEEYPTLDKGFTVKIHFGDFESVPHAKLHILCTE